MSRAAPSPLTETLPGGDRRTWVGRTGAKVVATTLRMVILIPALMLLAGGALVWMGHASLRQRVEADMRERVVDQVAGIARAAEDCLRQAPPLHEAVRVHALARRTGDAAAFAPLGVALLRHRPGVAFISLSYPDGSFVGVFIDHDRGDAIRVNQTWFEDDGTSTQRFWDVGDDGGIVPAKTQRDVGYDPRTRPFYAPAVAAKAPVWTPAYLFFNRPDLGITCSSAVRDPLTDDLVAVSTVDFDLSTLSTVLRTVVATGTPGSSAFIFTREGVELASSDASGQGSLAPSVRGAQFAAMVAFAPEDRGVRFFDLASSGQPSLAGVRRIAADGQEWFAGIEAPRAAFFASADRDLRRAMWVALVALSVAVGVAALLARFLARQQRLTRDAAAAAATAERKLQAMGSYTLVRELEIGGMGSVWKAEHRMLARPAALKLINPATLGRTEEERAAARARFEREARATARLRSRNTITLYDYGLAADGSFYYAMELLDGLDLDRLVERHGAQPAGRVVSLLMQACNSLAEAHAHGLVHRDIKPANLYLCRLGTEVDVVKVLDFGLVIERAGTDARITAAGVIRGTPAYMAPEQAQSRPVDGRADLYALGCVAYWLLTGRQVFEAADAMAAMVEHITATPRPLSAVAGRPVPAALERLVMALLAKDPAARPRDAAAVIAALREVEVPADQAWPPALAEAWWQEHRPRRLDEDSDPDAPAPARAVMPISI